MIPTRNHAYSPTPTHEPFFYTLGDEEENHYTTNCSDDQGRSSELLLFASLSHSRKNNPKSIVSLLKQYFPSEQ
jgi:hypothetical protein